eukprot:scaffold97775_cov17-Tisochrysis_lutea.AAC.1
MIQLHPLKHAQLQNGSKVAHGPHAHAHKLQHSTVSGMHSVPPCAMPRDTGAMFRDRGAMPRAMPRARGAGQRLHAKGQRRNAESQRCRSAPAKTNAR